jgi:adenylate cyclase
VFLLGCLRAHRLSSLAMSGLLRRVYDLGLSPEDSRDTRIQKRLQNAMCLVSIPLIALYGLLFVRLGMYDVLWSHALYCGGTAALLAMAGLTGQHAWVRYGHLAVVTAAPYLLHCYLGGFNASGGAFLWTLMAPLAAVMFLERRQTTIVVAIVVALLVASMWADTWSWTRRLGGLPPDEHARQLLINTLGITMFAFLSMRYFGDRFEQERARSESLLLNVLPRSIADRLKRGESPIADRVDAATVMFADLVGFTILSSRLPPERVVAMLDEIFTRFDDIADQHGLEKVKTIGDAYMAVAGLPERRDDHAIGVARAALAMRAAVRETATAQALDLDMRIGIHTGPVVAGVIGRRKFAYDLWGDAVNVASRMESHGAPGQIQVSADAAAALGGRFELDPRGEIEVKGKGAMRTFWLRAERGA